MSSWGDTFTEQLRGDIFIDQQHSVRSRLTGPCHSVRIAAVATTASALMLSSLLVALAGAPAVAQEAPPLARLPELRVTAPPIELGTLPRSWVPGRVEILTDAEIQSLRPS